MLHLRYPRYAPANISKWEDCKIFTKLLSSQTPSRSSHRRVSVKKGVFKNLRKLLEFRLLGLKNFLKKTLAQMFSCEISEVFKNNYFEEHLPTRSYDSTITPCCERLLLSFLEFTKLNHNFFLWLLWGHCFLYNNIINC